MAADIVNITVTEPADEVVAITVDEVNGDAGYAPVKGVDYFDGADGIDGANGINGIDGIDGVDGINGIDGFTETRQSILLKLGAATDASDGFLSRADHITFNAKQPAGAYILNTSITRGTKVYHSQGAGDQVGDWRTYSDSAGFYTQYCTAGAATRGWGTWSTKNTITI